MEFFKNLKFAWNYAKDQKKNLIWFISSGGRAHDF